MTEPSTPLMRQYAAIKKQHPNALLFFRLGDFYELFFEDAVVAARELQITLTSRNKEKDHAIPMGGVPYHAAENYLSKLLRKGFKVAICEQMEVPSAATKLVRREVTRVLTPGTAIDSSVGSPTAPDARASAARKLFSSEPTLESIAVPGVSTRVTSRRTSFVAALGTSICSQIATLNPLRRSLER